MPLILTRGTACRLPIVVLVLGGGWYGRVAGINRREAASVCSAVCL